MSEEARLVEKDDVCVVLVNKCVDGNSKTCLFGLYENREVAEKRVKEHIELGVIGDEDSVHYTNRIVWKYEDLKEE